MQAYVAECRGLSIRRIQLAACSQLRDFDVELAAYKEHVKEEIAQEAAAAGMTVEEYAANGYDLTPPRSRALAQTRAAGAKSQPCF